MNGLEVIEINGKLYKVIRRIKQENVRPDNEAIKAFTEYIHCDRSFKGNGYYYFVQDIDDIDYEQL